MAGANFSAGQTANGSGLTTSTGSQTAPNSSQSAENTPGGTEAIPSAPQETISGQEGAPGEMPGAPGPLPQSVQAGTGGQASSQPFSKVLVGFLSLIGLLLILAALLTTRRYKTRTPAPEASRRE